MSGSEYNPGSPEALGGGCTCDPELNRHGNGVLTPSDEPIFHAENGCPLDSISGIFARGRYAAAPGPFCIRQWIQDVRSWPPASTGEGAVISCKWLSAGLALLFSAMLTDASAQGPQTLRIGLAEDPDLLDPTMARTYVGRIVFASLCDKLVDISPELDIVPQLATEWRWTDNNKGLVMKIRSGVVFHDGDKMDAAAVKFSLERHLTLPGSNRKAEISALKSVEVVDDHTVKLVLDKPFAPLLAQLSNRAGMIVSQKAAEAAGDKFGEHPVCAGPYKFTERIAQDRILVDRFVNYWNKDAVHFDRIVFLPIVDSTVRLSNVQSGQLDLIERLAATDLDAARKDARLKI